jgi:hypothetical protein
MGDIRIDIVLVSKRNDFYSPPFDIAWFFASLVLALLYLLREHMYIFWLFEKNNKTIRYYVMITKLDKSFLPSTVNVAKTRIENIINFITSRLIVF